MALFSSCSSCLWPLDDSNEEDVIDTDRMSLHSNPGRTTNKKKKNKGSSRTVTLFGFHLFGRPSIYLPNDSQDPLYSDNTPTAHSTISSAALDSDAAPLDTDTIAALASPSTAAAALDNQRLKAREDRRRRRRRENREAERTADFRRARQGGGVSLDEGDEFEGFQGSGGGMGRRGVVAGLGSLDEAPRTLVSSRGGGEGEGDPDLDGSHYARTGTPSRSENRGSDTTRSRTSASMPKKPHGGSSSSSSGSSGSSSSRAPSARQLVSPSTVEQGQGFFDLEEEDVRPAKHESGGYLPITGFGGASTTASNRMASSLGAALAQRGQ